MKRLIPLFVVSIALWMVIPGCPGGGPSPGGGSGSGGNDNGNDNTGGGTGGPVKVLEAATLNALQAVSDDSLTFTFDASAAQTAGLQVNDLIVATVHPPLLPYGALRRVSTVERADNTVTVTTTPVALADAVEEGSLSARIPLTLEQATTTPKMRLQQLGPGQLVFPIEETVLFDGDGDETTDHDQVTLEGNLSMTPDVVIDIDISNFTLDHASVAVEGDVIADLTIRADREATIPIFDKLLHTQPFTPVIFPLGPIPVVLVPILEIHAGAEGSVSAAMSAHLTYEADGAVGFEYDGGFQPILEVDPSGSADIPEFLEGAKATGKVWLSAKFKVAFYGLAGVYVDSRFFGEVGVDVDGCPWWELFVGVEGKAGAFVEVNVALFDAFGFSGTILDWSTDPLSKKVLVADAGGCAPSNSLTDIVTWARSYGAEGLDSPTALAITSDGGAVITATTTSFTAQSDAILFKIDALGHIAWQLAYDDLEAAVAVRPIDDGYYLLAGENTVSAFFVPPFLPSTYLSDAKDPPAYLLRLDANGSPVWARAIASAEEALDAVGLAQLADGSVVVAGTMGDPPDGEDVWLARFSEAGEQVWARRITEPGTQQSQSLIVDSADDIVLLASAGATCDFLLKMDADGNARWQACYGSSHNNFAAELVETTDGYTLVGHLSNDAQLNHVDRDGNLLWARHIDSDVHEVIELPDGSRIEAPDETPYDEAYSAAALPGGDLLVSGKAGLGNDADFWITRLNGEGQAQWIRRYGGSLDDEAGGWLEFARAASTIAPTADGGALIAGYSRTFSHATAPESFDLDIWILKIRASGTVDLDAGSGASSAPVGGEVYEVQHFGGPTDEVADGPLLLIVEAFTPVVFSPNVETARQGGPP